MLQFRTPASNGSQTTTNRASSPSRFPNLMSPDFQGREQSQNWRRGCLSNICGKKHKHIRRFISIFASNSGLQQNVRRLIEIWAASAESNVTF